MKNWNSDKTKGLIIGAVFTLLVMLLIQQVAFRLPVSSSVKKPDSAAAYNKINEMMSYIDGSYLGEVDEQQLADYMFYGLAAGLAVAKLSGEVIVNHPCACMTALSSTLDKEPQIFIDMQKALIRAFDVYEHQPDVAIPLIQKYLQLDTEVIKADAYSRFSPNPEINRTAAHTFWDAMNEIGYIQSDLDIDKHLRTEFFETAIAELVKENPDNAFYKELAKGGYGSNV